jgi:O-antigen biosynthesis protein
MKFSIIMPVYKPNISHLLFALKSVREQTFPLDLFELIVVIDPYGEVTLPREITQALNSIPNLIITSLEKHGGISQTSNEGAKLANGDYLIFLDQDDELTLDALSIIDVFLNTLDTQPGFIHSNYLNISKDGSIIEAIKTPKFSPVRLLSHMYAAHLKIFNREIFLELGGFTSEYDGLQDFELALKFSQLGHFQHIDRALYHWRASDTSSQSSILAKPKIPNLTKQLIQNHVLMKGIDAKSYFLKEFPTLIGLEFVSVPMKRFSIIIPTDLALIPDRPAEFSVSRIIRELLITEDLDFEIFIVIHERHRKNPYVAELLRTPKIKLVFHEMRIFNFSDAVNLGVSKSEGDFIVLLNDDVYDLSKNWPKQVVGWMTNYPVGVIGAKLKYPNGDPQHIGVGIDSSLHAYHPLPTPGVDVGALGEGLVDHEVDAVTGAFLVTTREVWNAVGGFPSEFPNNYNDLVFCIKARKHGLSVLQCNSISACHEESLTREPTRSSMEIQMFHVFCQTIGSDYVRGYTLTSESLNGNKNGFIKKVYNSIQFRGVFGALKNFFSLLQSRST